MPFTTETIEPGTELMTVNMGPSHPSTHGVLRLVLTLDGERVVKAVPVMGYLHRGMEKIAENKTYTQFIPYTDRLDYLAPLSNNVAFALAVEKLVGVTVPPRCQFIRVLVCEMSRISAHLLWLGTHAVDLGAISVFMYTFREREVLYNFFEALTGTRLTTSYTRIGGLTRDLPAGFLDGVSKWLDRFSGELDEYEKLLTKNKIWVERTQGVGVLQTADAIELGISGPSLRACGYEWDLRKTRPYLCYDQLEFD